MFVDVLKILLKVIADILFVEKYLLEVLLYHSQYASQFYVSKSCNYEVSYCVILVTYQYRKFNVKPLHELGRLALSFIWFSKSDLPMR